MYVIPFNDYPEGEYSTSLWCWKYVTTKQESCSRRYSLVSYESMSRVFKTRIQELRLVLNITEPYLLFIDTVNEMSPEEYKNENIEVSTSNLCTEITLRTDDKHSGVCCLGSINLEYWDEYQSEFDQFITDSTDYLDNVLQSFIDLTTDLPGFERARAGAVDERSIGLGVMGFHSLLQSKMIPWESPMAKGLNLKIFKQIKEATSKHNEYDGLHMCPMANRNYSKKRNIHVTAIAPTMSISSLCGVASSGIEPWVANAFTKKVQQGSFAITNKYLDEYLQQEAVNEACLTTCKRGTTWYDDQWDSIKKAKGSVQQLEWMDDNTKAVFKTAFEIDQRWLIEFAGDRQPFIDQAQSINLFIPGNSHVQYISDLHILAWKRKLKSLYYLRSSAVNTASTTSTERKDIMEDTCLSCT